MKSRQQYWLFICFSPIFFYSIECVTRHIHSFIRFTTTAWCFHFFCWIWHAARGAYVVVFIPRNEAWLMYAQCVFVIWKNSMVFRFNDDDNRAIVMKFLWGFLFLIFVLRGLADRLSPERIHGMQRNGPFFVRSCIEATRMSFLIYLLMLAECREFLCFDFINHYNLSNKSSVVVCAYSYSMQVCASSMEHFRFGWLHRS